MSNPPKLGEYPYPREDDRFDSPALTWLRNYSSYLTAGGPLGTIGALAIYIRGVIGNLLIVTPLLMVVGIALGLLHRQIDANTERIVAGYGFVAMVFFSIYFGNATLKVMLTRFELWDRGMTGLPEESQPNDFWLKRGWKNTCVLLAVASRQLAGTLVALGICILLVIASPQVIEFFWRSGPFDSFTFQQCLAVITTLIAISGGIAKKLTGAGELGKNIGFAAIALVGFVILWLITLRIATYIYYGTPPTSPQTWFPIALAAAFLIASLASCIGRANTTWRFNYWPPISVLASIILCFLGYWLNGLLEAESSRDKDDLVPLTQAISQLSNAVRDGSKMDSSKSSNRAESVDQTSPKPEYQQTFLKLENYRKKLVLRFQAGALDDEQTLSTDDYHLAQKLLHEAESLGNLTMSQRQRLANDLTTPCVDSMLKIFEDTLKLSSGETEAIGTSDEADEQAWRSACQEAIALEVLRTNKELRRAVVSNEQRAVAEDDQNRAELSFIKAVQSARQRLNETLKDEAKDRKEDKPEQPLRGQLSRLIGGDLISVQNSSDPPAFADFQKQVEDSIKKFEVEAVPEVTADSVVKGWFAPSVALGFGDLEETVRNVLMTHRVKDLPGLQAFPIHLVNNDESADRSEDVVSLVRLALCGTDQTRRIARELLGELYDPGLCSWEKIPVDHSPRPADTVAAKKDLYEALFHYKSGSNFPPEAARLVLASHLIQDSSGPADELIRRMVAGHYGNLEGIKGASHELFKETFYGRLLLMSVCGAFLLLFNFAFNSPNATSIHSFYRDRLRAAFIVQPAKGKTHTDAEQRVGPRERIRLSELVSRNANDTGPYPLICGALNLQGSSNAAVRDRNACSFLFSPLFVSSDMTKYISTLHMEQIDSDLTVDSAMALSAGAAAPNMGKYTMSWLSFLIVLLNVRLGRWMVHPEVVASAISKEAKRRDGNAESTEVVDFKYVQEQEVKLIRSRRNSLKIKPRSELSSHEQFYETNSKQEDLFGLALSGGGIRSASIALGVTQTLHRAGLFKELDYLSSVSGGGYTATAISTFMSVNAIPEQVQNNSSAGAANEGKTTEASTAAKVELPNLRRWSHRAPARYLLREMTTRVRESLPWVYVSDGGHFENMAAYELLKRKARIIILSDGEADAKSSLGGLAALTRLAEIDLKAKIVFAPGTLERLVLRKPKDAEDNDPWRSESNFAVAKIYYESLREVGEPDGWLVYIRSTLLDDEDAIIENFAKDYKAFPHQSTTDQSFDELQFEAYRRLGEKMMERTLDDLKIPNQDVGYTGLITALKALD